MPILQAWSFTQPGRLLRPILLLVRRHAPHAPGPNGNRHPPTPTTNQDQARCPNPEQGGQLVQGTSSPGLQVPNPAPPTPCYLAELRATIIERGVDEAIIVDEDGQIVDGWQRYTICQELGIFCPRQVRKFGSEAEKFELALMRNCNRRQLDRKQKKLLISTYLQVDSRISDNWLATIIGGVGKNHVASVRAELIASDAIQAHKNLRGRDGKHRPARYARIMVNNPAELVVVQKAMPNLSPSFDGRFIDATTAARQARRCIGQRIREAELHTAKAHTIDNKGNIQLYCGDCLDVMAQRIKVDPYRWSSPRRPTTRA